MVSEAEQELIDEQNFAQQQSSELKRQRAFLQNPSRLREQGFSFFLSGKGRKQRQSYLQSIGRAEEQISLRQQGLQSYGTELRAFEAEQDRFNKINTSLSNISRRGNLKYADIAGLNPQDQQLVKDIFDQAQAGQGTSVKEFNLKKSSREGLVPIFDRRLESGRVVEDIVGFSDIKNQQTVSFKDIQSNKSRGNEFISNVQGRRNNFLTKEQFVVSRSDIALGNSLQRRADFISTLNPTQITEFSNIPGSGISIEKMSRADGSLRFTITPNQEELANARQVGLGEFRNLPTRERFRLGTGNIFVGGIRGGLSAAEGFAEFPLQIFGNQVELKGGRVRSKQVVDFDFIPQKLENIPVGTSGRISEGIVGIGLPLLAVGSQANTLRKAGFTAKEIAGEFALGLAPIRPKTGRFVSDQFFVGTSKEVSTSSIGFGEINARGILDPRGNIKGLAVSKGDRVGSLFRVRTPFIEIGRGGKITSGIDTSAQFVSGKIGKGGITNIITKEIGFGKEKIKIGQDFTSREFTGFSTDIPSGRSNRVTGSSFERPVTDKIDLVSFGDVKISRQDFTSISNPSSLTIRQTKAPRFSVAGFKQRFRLTRGFEKGTNIILARRVNIEGLDIKPPTGLGDVGTIINTGGKKSSQEFFTKLNQVPKFDSQSLLNVARVQARNKILFDKPISTGSSQRGLLLGGDAFAVLRQQRSEFAGTGQYEKTVERFFDNKLISNQKTISLVNTRGFERQDIRFNNLLLTSNRGDTRQASILATGQIGGLATGQLTKLGQKTGQFELQGFKGGDGVGESGGETFIDIPTFRPPRAPRGRGGFFPGLPTPGDFDPFRRRARGIRKLKRTPSFVSLFTGFRSSRQLPGEETGLIARPVIRARRKSKKR